MQRDEGQRMNGWLHEMFDVKRFVDATWFTWIVPHDLENQAETLKLQGNVSYHGLKQDVPAKHHGDENASELIIAA